jgi:orotate phosphoribosyltransferase
VVLLDREQGGKEHLRTQNIEPHVLFNISEAFDWLREVELLSASDYQTIMAYIDTEKDSSENTAEAGAAAG